MKPAREVIAEALPTFIECYESPRVVHLPSKGDLETKADAIILALDEAGYHVVPK